MMKERHDLSNPSLGQEELFLDMVNTKKWFYKKRRVVCGVGF